MMDSWQSDSEIPITMCDILTTMTDIALQLKLLYIDKLAFQQFIVICKIAKIKYLAYVTAYYFE